MVGTAGCSSDDADSSDDSPGIAGSTSEGGALGTGGGTAGAGGRNVGVGGSSIGDAGRSPGGTTGVGAAGSHAGAAGSHAGAAGSTAGVAGSAPVGTAGTAGSAGAAGAAGVAGFLIPTITLGGGTSLGGTANTGGAVATAGTPGNPNAGAGGLQSGTAGSSNAGIGGVNTAGTAGSGSPFNTRVSSLPTLTQATPIDPAQSIECDPKPAAAEVFSGAYVCGPKCERLARSFSSLLSLDADKIYPGALFNGASVKSGTYTPISAQRAPITIQAFLANLAQPVAAKVPSPDRTGVTEAVVTILTNNHPNNEAAEPPTCEVVNIHSADQLDVAIGANLQTGAGRELLKYGFDFTRSDVYSRAVVKVTHPYFTVTTPPPAVPSDLFVSSDTVDTSKFGPVSPLYVTSAVYGRLALFTIESTRSPNELGSDLAKVLANCGLGTSAAVILDGELPSLVDTTSTTIKGIVFGDGGVDSLSSGAKMSDRLKNAVAYLGVPSYQVPVVPIQYGMSHLSNGLASDLVLGPVDYRVTGCRRPSYNVTLVNLVCPSNADAGSEAEIFGNIYSTAAAAAAPSPPGSFSFWYPGSPANIGLKDGSIAVNSTVKYTFPQPTDTASITIQGEMWEDDDYWLLGTNHVHEYMGFPSKQILIKDIGVAATSHTITFSGDGETVNANFSVQRVYLD